MSTPYSTLKVRQSLKTLGFSDNETKVFLFLLRYKKATARTVSQQTLLAFSSTQYTLSSLVSHGLVHMLPGEEEIFEAIAGKSFYNWIDKREQTHKNQYRDAKKDLGNFFSRVKESGWKPDVIYYEGKNGIRDIYEDMLDTGLDIYCWTDVNRTYKVLGHDYMMNFREQRRKKNIKVYTIKPIEDVPDSIPPIKREVKNLKHLSINGEICIYGNKVAIIQFHSKKPVGFVFDGKWIRILFQSVFDSVWKN